MVFPSSGGREGRGGAPMDNSGTADSARGSSERTQRNQSSSSQGNHNQPPPPSQTETTRRSNRSQRNG